MIHICGSSWTDGDVTWFESEQKKTNNGKKEGRHTKNFFGVVDRDGTVLRAINLNTCDKCQCFFF